MFQLVPENFEEVRGDLRSALEDLKSVPGDPKGFWGIGYLEVSDEFQEVPVILQGVSGALHTIEILLKSL